jgi:hypothetical protein
LNKTGTEDVRENTQTAEFRSAAHRQAVSPDSNSGVRGWMRDVGFSETYVEGLTVIESMVVGVK